MSSFSSLDRGPAFTRSKFRTVCSVRDPAYTDTGGINKRDRDNDTVTTNVPCALQPLSSDRAMRFGKQQDGETVLDLYLDAKYPDGTTLGPITTDWEFVVDGVSHQSIGEGLSLGSTQRVAVSTRAK